MYETSSGVIMEELCEGTLWRNFMGELYGGTLWHIHSENAS